MPILVSCDCGEEMRVGDDVAGKRIRCPSCNSMLTVPDVSPSKDAPRQEAEDAIAETRSRRPHWHSGRRSPSKDKEDEAGFPASRAKATRSFTLPLIVGLVGGALVLLVVVLVIVF